MLKQYNQTNNISMNLKLRKDSAKLPGEKESPGAFCDAQNVT